ncbi:hypothetical protein V6N12_014810 [Hibiscus sabdariffa]|uniref:Uncharacterized protein n=1 Tax=Hibiscus sabdariffa TaxID=183260 RepID=A0ABR2DLB0_9ROSI
MCMLDHVRKIYNVFPKVPLPSNVPDDDDVRELNEALGAAKTRLEGCSSFLRAAIKWSAEFGASRNGDPQLHVMLAEYIYSESTELCYPGEDDLAIARPVLMYLSMGNLQDANYLMDELKRQMESQELDFPESDLIQFITFLLLTDRTVGLSCLVFFNLEATGQIVILYALVLHFLGIADIRRLERDASPLFNMLRVNYKSSIDREPAFNELLDEIAEKKLVCSCNFFPDDVMSKNMAATRVCLNLLEFAGALTDPDC